MKFNKKKHELKVLREYEIYCNMLKTEQYIIILRQPCVLVISDNFTFSYCSKNSDIYVFFCNEKIGLNFNGFSPNEIQKPEFETLLYNNSLHNFNDNECGNDDVHETIEESLIKLEAIIRKNKIKKILE